LKGMVQQMEVGLRAATDALAGEPCLKLGVISPHGALELTRWQPLNRISHAWKYASASTSVSQRFGDFLRSVQKYVQGNISSLYLMGGYHGNDAHKEWHFPSFRNETINSIVFGGDKWGKNNFVNVLPKLMHATGAKHIISIHAVAKGELFRWKVPGYCEQQVFLKYRDEGVSQLKSAFREAGVFGVKLHTFFLYQDDADENLRSVLDALKKMELMSASIADLTMTSRGANDEDESVAFLKGNAAKALPQTWGKLKAPNAKHIRSAACIWGAATSQLNVKAVLQVGGGPQLPFEYMYYRQTSDPSVIQWHSASEPIVKECWDAWHIQRTFEQLEADTCFWHDTKGDEYKVCIVSKQPFELSSLPLGVQEKIKKTNAMYNTLPPREKKGRCTCLRRAKASKQKKADTKNCK